MSASVSSSSSMAGRTFEATSLRSRATRPKATAGRRSDSVRAPMPGSVVEVHKRPGDGVARGETLVTIESMKLQIALVAPRDGASAPSPAWRPARRTRRTTIVAALEPLPKGN